MQVSLQIFASPLEEAHAQWGSGLLPPASSELSLLVAGRDTALKILLCSIHRSIKKHINHPKAVSDAVKQRAHRCEVQASRPLC